MQIVDFTRSYFTFRVDTLKKPPRTVTHKLPTTLNNARIQVDCWCEVQERRTGARVEFLLGASCKTERVNVPEGIWTQPNADFIPVVSRDQFLTVKTFDHAGRRVMLYPPELGEQPHRHIVPVEKAFDALTFQIRRLEAEALEGIEELIDAARSGRPLVARTELANERYRACLQYPVKTLNFSERERFYQTDTGPVLLPDLSRDPQELLDGMDLAFAAFNSPGWTEFIVRERTEISGGVGVYHYSRPVRFDAVNQLFHGARPDEA
jgi:hypothetical protein